MARSWIPNKITRRPTTPCEHILVNIVCDLIDPDAWDHELVKNLFWEDDVMVILAIPLKEVQGGELELNLSSLEPLQNFGAPCVSLCHLPLLSSASPWQRRAIFLPQALLLHRGELVRILGAGNVLTAIRQWIRGLGGRSKVVGEQIWQHS
jgi:hypothetical protein